MNITNKQTKNSKESKPVIKAGRGRPTKYKDINLETVTKLYQLGLNDKKAAQFFGISVSTLQNWKEKKPEFAAAVLEGKIHADLEVVDALRKRATGYKYTEKTEKSLPKGKVTETQTKHKAPSVGAIKLWLKNRWPGIWSDTQSVEITGDKGGPIQVQNLDLSGLSFDELKFIESIGISIASNNDANKPEDKENKEIK